MIVDIAITAWARDGDGMLTVTVDGPLISAHDYFRIRTTSAGRAVGVSHAKPWVKGEIRWMWAWKNDGRTYTEATDDDKAMLTALFMEHAELRDLGRLFGFEED